MKIIGLVPVRNEAWILPHSLASLSGFCDVVIVSDQNSDDRSREICRTFPKVALLESSECRISTQVRWQLLDAARGYDGCNLLWCTDADELVAPRAAVDFFAARRDELKPGTVIECTYLHLWHSPARYREYDWRYGPHLKQLALVDDRMMDYDRSRPLSIHEPRVPLDGASGTIRAPDVRVLHLQWLLAGRTQMRQAWYRCREWLDGKAAAAINEDYSGTLPDPRARTAALPAAWAEGLTFPDLAIDREPAWNERDILAWFEQHTPEFFEPLEIWHIPVLRDAFERRAGRRPFPTARTGHPGRCAPATSDGASPHRRGAAYDCEMARPFLTVLTAPIPTTARRLYRGLRSRMRPLVKPGVPLPKASPFPGHYALVRSVVEGLRAIHADFNFNPRRLSELARVVYAPENAALRQAAALKRRGNIDYLVAGPVNALFADEDNGILRLPEIDRLIVACEWARDFYRDAPQLLQKSVPCPCGVDPGHWKPTGQPRKNIALVYWKSGDEAFCGQVEHIVRTCGLEPRRVRSAHGEHALFAPDDYRRLLDEAVVGVFLSTFETQGLALAEAWSMDVPTVVWDPRGTAEWRGRSFQAGSSAPYLTPATGRLWRTMNELEPVLRGVLAERAAFHPREWVATHMTDAICSAALYDIIRKGWAARHR